LSLALVNGVPRTNGRVVYIVKSQALRGFIAQRPLERRVRPHTYALRECRDTY
jgi:hypothetical protein